MATITTCGEIKTTVTPRPSEPSVVRYILCQFYFLSFNKASFPAGDGGEGGDIQGSISSGKESGGKNISADGGNGGNITINQ